MTSVKRGLPTFSGDGFAGMPGVVDWVGMGVDCSHLICSHKQSYVSIRWEEAICAHPLPLLLNDAITAVDRRQWSVLTDSVLSAPVG